MSPESQLKRKQQQRLHHDDMQRRLRKYEHTEIPLDEEQHNEMINIVDKIDEHFPSELNQLIAEGITNLISMVFDLLSRTVVLDM